MKGEVLKSQLLKIEPTLTEVARKLEVSKQSLSQALTASDIKTGFIEKLASVYNRPVGFFFGEDDKGEEIKNNAPDEHDELIRLREENKYLHKIVADKEKLINFFTNNK